MSDPVKHAYEAARRYVADTGDPVHGSKFKAYQEFREACTRAQLNPKAVLREVRGRRPP